MDELLIKSVLSYLLGSIVGSLVIGRVRGVDIRTLGSGNPGSTNALRTQGAWFAAAVILIDVGKGWLAAGVLPRLALPGVPINPGISRLWLADACAIAVVLGHVYPLWYGFRGGKGAATLVGVVIGLRLDAVAPVLGVWFGVLLLTGFVGLATMVASATFPLYVATFVSPSTHALLALGVAMAAFVTFTHRGNIARMRAGTESRAQRVWLLRPR